MIGVVAWGFLLVFYRITSHNRASRHCGSVYHASRDRGLTVALRAIVDCGLCIALRARDTDRLSDYYNGCVFLFQTRLI